MPAKPPSSHSSGAGANGGAGRRAAPRQALSPFAREWQAAAPNRLTRAIEKARLKGRPPLDLVTANPHDHGLEFPVERLAEITFRALRERPTVRRYAPHPLGQPEAREAVAAWYHRRGYPAARPERVCLTPGTSLAYFYALRLLAEPGAEVLVPRPSYPLFDDLCAAADVRPRAYHLAGRPEGWRLDLEDLAFQITPRTRAVIAVSPHNPTGMIPSAEDWSALGAICRRHRLPLILDEVFCEFLEPPGAPFPRPDGEEFPLLLILNGLSKMFSLPGWKTAWILAGGEADETTRFFTALERLADTFLPVHEFSQAALPDLFAGGESEVAPALARELAVRRALARDLAPRPARAPQGGEYLSGRLPEGADDETLAREAIERAGVLVQPG